MVQKHLNKYMPLVTVVVLSYNNSSFVINTLQSINEQSYPAIELIVVDDYSNDNSVAVIQEWLSGYKKPYKLVVHEQNMGVTTSCNDGLSLATGKYFCVIGSDDIMDVDRLLLQIKMLEQTSDDVSAIFSDMLIIDEFGIVEEKTFFEKLNINHSDINHLLNSALEVQLASLIELNIIPAPSMLYKYDSIVKVGGYDEQLYFEDLDINLKLIASGNKIIFTEDKLVLYRVLAKSLSRKPNAKYIHSYLSVIYVYKGINKKIDRIINNKIAGFAEVYYQLNGENASRWLFVAFINKLNFANAFLLIGSSFGISYKKIFSIKKLIKKIL